MPVIISESCAIWLRNPIFEVSLQWQTNKVRCHLDISLECRFNTIYGFESKWCPLLFISRILFYCIESPCMLLALVVDKNDHVIHLAI